MTAAGSFTDPTVYVALIGAFAGFFSIILASLLSQRNQRVARTKLDAQGEQITEIHILVNSKMAEALARIAALESELGLAAGEEIVEQKGDSRATERDRP